ncbi:RagB/SusD family nutrient uptake outer membrane protein [Olivibacter sp. XZL3]|uniref:RagB/SusD family nutrient uptake outer membrane protein n=1 Tax=Olivibacter sp. XZL3 TaxID=1735116 RepID=UPI001064824A|nr:RagB/SusD family nutrient uptake outer membrane protein [Olivibacter sp. XZL3]
MIHKTQSMVYKKKDHKVAAWIVIGLLAFSGCSKELDQEPRLILEETFYNTAAEAEAAVNAIFPPIRLGAQGIASYNATLECHTDYAYGRGSWAQFNDFSGLDATNTNRVGDFWDSFYLAIRNANLVIKNVPEGDAMSEEEKNRYVAEARFMRAWCYFHLVRNWGGVPLRVETNMEEKDVARSAAEEVYALIDEDLRFAETYLPENNTAQPGRPTKWMAKTVLSDYLLTTDQNQEARDKAAEVMQSGLFSLVPIQGVNDFEHIFGAGVGVTSEEVFHFKYTREEQGNYYPFIINHPETGYFMQGRGAYAQYSNSNNNFYKGWNDADLRKQLWYPMDIGLGEGTVLQKKFTDPGATNEYGAINDFPLYRYAEVLLLFAEAEARANGVTAESLNALNQVKRRAYGRDITSPSDVDYQIASFSPESLIDTILQERAYEFQFEGKRWFDLKRSGKAAEILQQNKEVAIAEKHYLWPIPLAEMNYNQGITENNPGY